MEKVTKKEMFAAIAEAMETGECKFAPEVVIEFCNKEIDALDRKAEKAKERAAKKAKEADELADLVVEALTDEFQTIADVTEAVTPDFPDATVAKVQYRLTQLVKAGVAEKESVTIPATETTKTRHVMGYRKAAGEVEEG